MKKRYLQLISVFLLGVAMMGATSCAYADDSLMDIEQLKLLKQEDPEKFQALMLERKQKIKEKMRRLKEENPQEYERVREKMIEHRKQRFERIRQEDPEQYERLIQQKRQKFESFRQNNPEAYERFAKKHPNLVDRINRSGPSFERGALGGRPQHDLTQRKLSKKQARLGGGRRSQNTSPDAEFGRG